MKHIKKVTAAEKSLKELFKVATDLSPVTADDTHIASINKIVELTRKSDELLLEISKEKAALMGYMQGHTSMEDADGKTLITWKNGSDKVDIDYDGIFLEMNVPPAVIAKHTSTHPGARVFTIVEE